MILKNICKNVSLLFLVVDIISIFKNVKIVVIVNIVNECWIFIMCIFLL